MEFLNFHYAYLYDNKKRCRYYCKIYERTPIFDIDGVFIYKLLNSDFIKLELDKLENQPFINFDIAKLKYITDPFDKDYTCF